MEALERDPLSLSRAAPGKLGSPIAEPSPARQRLGFECDRSHRDAASPFDELALSAAALTRAAADIRARGYATIPIAPETRRFFDAEIRKPPNRSTRVNAAVHDLRDGPYAAKITTSARRLLAKLETRETTLEPQEIEIRHNPGTTNWHTDKAPKTIVMLAAVRGAGTDFIEPGDVDTCLTSESAYSEFEPRDPDALKRHARQADPNEFIVFAGQGVEDKSIPRLVHRSPPDGDLARAIFLARWRKTERHAPWLTAAPSSGFPSLHV